MNLAGAREGRVRVTPFHVEHWPLLRPACSRCPFTWGAEAPMWAQAAQDEWGQVGVAFWENDAPVAHALVTTPLHVPRTGPHAGVALSHDAAVLMALRTARHDAAHGRWLLQGVAAMVARGPATFHAVESEATIGDPTCVTPTVDLLSSAGFVACRPDPDHPRMRLDLDRTARWRPHLGLAVDRIRWWAHPLPPEPASRAGVQRQ